MNKIGIMQPYIFPHFAYFQLMSAVDEYIIYDDVQYIKGGWINRNNILMGGQKILFTIQLKDASPNKMINEISINDNFEKFLKTVLMAYSKAPYIREVYDVLRKICDCEDHNLARFTANSFYEISKYIGMRTKYTYSSDLNKDNTMTGQAKVIQICREMNADIYINSIGGKDLYSASNFQEHGIGLKFLESHNPSYKQLKKEFVPSLSIIDVMMFNSPADIRKMLDEYDLI